MSEEPLYTMSISLNVLNHLGIGLYSNVPAVLSEVVANSWDADAENVEIQIDTATGEIEIMDDGIGMTRDDINSKFLMVGYQKRLNEPAKTPKGRPLMGRKGIGKLSVFSIADTVVVHSIKNGEKSGLVMSREDIEDDIKDESRVYHPDVVEPDEIDIDSGTRIILSDVRKSFHTAETYLRRRLARRFSIIGKENDFNVSINDELITVRDREFFPNLEFLWYFGDQSSRYIEKSSNLSKSKKLEPVVDEVKGLSVSGWIGTVKDQKSIDELNNSIVVFARGKLIQEDILREFKEGGIFSKYIIGEINAEFMDQDDKEDLVTSNRQSVKEDDERYISLKEFIQRALKIIQSDWSEFRREVGVKKALLNPTIEKWYERLEGDHKKYARKLFGNIESLPGADGKVKTELYRSGILAFEKLALTDTLSKIDLIETEENFELIKALFDSIDEIEAVHYHQIAKGRLAVVRKFEELVDSSPVVKEKVLQEYIFDHLWLLHPSWERAASNFRLEETVKKEFDAITESLSDEEKKGRIDIRYKTAAGKHIIVELKKYDVSANIYDLQKQISKYISALNKCLDTASPDQSNVIEVICILGKHPSPDEERSRNIELLKNHNARYILYDQLIKEAYTSYSEYLEKHKEIGDLLTIIEELEIVEDILEKN